MIGRSRSDTRRDRRQSGFDDRAQTLQDFAVGIGIFLLAVAFVFAFVPTIITPFADSGTPDTAQADRIAATIVEQASTGQANKLDPTVFNSGGRYDGNSEELADELGLRSTDTNAIDNVNIVLIDIDDASKSNPTPAYSTGDTYDRQVGASATRIVTTADSNKCEPACQLIVRVW